MAFEWASWLENNHIIVHAADLQLNPPQSYLFVQDFLIILCALLYCFCYVFYTLRTKRDRFLAGPVDLLYVHLFISGHCHESIHDLLEDSVRFGNLAYELGIGWCEVLYLWKHAHTKGQSLEIWVVRFCGVLSAMAVFFWRYLNVPQNWAYVVSWPSIVLVVLNAVPELMCPFLYRRAERKMREAAAVQKENNLFNDVNDVRAGC
ncbi:hypothetical protein MAJ_09692, partial [Metarhizium majus ARSEF 297]